MKTADGFPVVCYGVKNKGSNLSSHDICKRCAIYHLGKGPLTKPAYRLEGIHKPNSRTCPLFEPKDTRL